MVSYDVGLDTDYARRDADFSVDDNISTNESFFYGGANGIVGTGFGRLSRMAGTTKHIQCEACEGYLEKKSPNLFIKWQVRISTLILGL